MKLDSWLLWKWEREIMQNTVIYFMYSFYLSSTLIFQMHMYSLGMTLFWGADFEIPQNEVSRPRNNFIIIHRSCKEYNTTSKIDVCFSQWNSESIWTAFCWPCVMTPPSHGSPYARFWTPAAHTSVTPTVTRRSRTSGDWWDWSWAHFLRWDFISIIF